MIIGSMGKRKLRIRLGRTRAVISPALTSPHRWQKVLWLYCPGLQQLFAFPVWLDSKHGPYAVWTLSSHFFLIHWVVLYMASGGFSQHTLNSFLISIIEGSTADVQVLSVFNSKLISNLPCSPQLALSPWSISSVSINAEHPLVSLWASPP